MAGSKWLDQSGMVPAENDGDNMPVERETGIVEKLLNTYGFIRCCDRQARLFFHYSQFSGTIDHLKPGDAVDFEMTFDKKSGKPIAINVTRIPSDITRGDGQTLTNGVITTELNSEGKGGRVAYDNCGECFFFEFSRKDLCDPNMEGPRVGQPVQFLVIQSATGRPQATEVRLAAATAAVPMQQQQPQQQQQQQQQQQSRKAQQHFITPPLMYPGMMVPIMPAGIAGPQVIAAYNPAAPLQVAHVVNGATNGRMLQSAVNGNGNAKDVEGILAGHSQQHAGYKVTNNSNNSTPSSIQHFSGQSTKQNAQQPGHQAAGGGLNYIGPNSPTTSATGASPNKVGGQNSNKNKNHRTADDGADQQENNQNQRYQGVVCTFKETYGFVERADVVKEIFFHCSEGYEGIALGDDVSFDIATRSNRTVAVKLKRLPAGTVIFSDLEENVRKGTILKLYNQTEEPLNGRVVCEENGEQIQFGFGDRDIAPSLWTMRVGDPVTFQVATDRRDEAKQATNIMLNTSAPGAFSKETRLVGSVATLKENYGFIMTEQDNTKYYFKLNEVLDPELRIDNVVQFTVSSEYGNQNNSNRQVAIRICKLANQQQMNNKKKALRKSNAKCTNRGFVSALKDHFGFIESESHLEDLFFHFTSIDGDIKDFKVGSEVEYSLVKRDRPSAEVVRLLEKGSIPELELISDAVYTGKVMRSLRCHNPEQVPYTGLIEVLPSPELDSKDAEIKEEPSKDVSSEEEPSGEDVSKEDDSKENSEAGSAEAVADAESADVETVAAVADANADGEAKDDVEGEVTDEAEVKTDDETNANTEQSEYEFSVMSLAKAGEVVQRNDRVEFQLAVCKVSGRVFAVNVKSIRKQAAIEMMKGNIAILNYELDGNRKLTFNTSEVVMQNGSREFSPGDVVEFDLIRSRNNKLVATAVTRIREKEASPRPASLINRMKSMAVSEEGPRVVAIRQPKGPDGTRGFLVAVA